MLKYAFMTWSTPELTLGENLEVAAMLGYDGIEARMSGKVERYVGDTTVQNHGIELYASRRERAEARKMIAGSGVDLCCIATSIQYADPAKADVQVEDTLRTIDLAYDMGCPRLRVFGGQFPDGVSREAASDSLVSCLSRSAEYARDAGVTLCIEVHDAWSDPRHLVPVVERVDHPAVRINWDVAHATWRTGMDVTEAFGIVRSWIAHVHVHDMTFTDKTFVNQWIGEGILDHEAVIGLLMSVGYEGYVSGEWINREPGWREHLGRELAAMKSFELKRLYPS